MIHVVSIWQARGLSVLERYNPFVVSGELHVEREIRIETILPAFRKSTITRALLSVHPYEEPVFDFYP